MTEERVLLITGGSRGIGAAVARRAVADGYRVAFSYRSRRDAADALAEELDSTGKRVRALRADVSVPRDVQALFRAVDQTFGPLDVLVNNAGILERHARVEEIDAERLARVLGVNVIGAFLCAAEAVKRMSTRHGGRGGAIVNVSSMAAVLGGPNEYVDYAASKGAIDSLTVGLAKEVAAEGVRVTGVRPGLIHTDIHASGGDPGRVERLAPNVPLQRGGSADEVARAILWLASDAASYCTGTTLDVSGGR